MPDRAPPPRPIRGVHSSEPPVNWRVDARDDDPGLPLVVCLHGWGMDEDFFAILLQRLADLPFRLLLPCAPFAVSGLKEGRHGASWYEYDGDQDRFLRELARTEELVIGLAKDVESHLELRPRGRYLLGFSQGGYCGSWVALRNAGFFDGMTIVGARVKTEFLADEMKRAEEIGFRSLLCHGERDASVRPEAAKRSHAGMIAAGLDVELRWFDAAHTLGRRQVSAIGEWLVADQARRESAKKG